jgi:opacity protein-like surface antigen
MKTQIGVLMKTKFWSGVGVLASIMTGVGAASAADLAVNAPVYKAPPPVLSDWSGFYIGVNGGYGWAATAIPDLGIDGSAVPLNPKGGLFGGHAGYNWQYKSVVTGVEVDFDGADINGTSSATTSGIPLLEPTTAKINELASARARLGYLVLPDLLAYGTAGAGWDHTNLSFAANPGVQVPALNGGVSQFGWVAGAGLEYKFYGNWIARAEYLHYDFDASSVNVSGVGIPTSPVSLSRETVDAVRGGLSYKF